jgi:hypothetical protein
MCARARECADIYIILALKILADLERNLNANPREFPLHSAPSKQRSPWPTFDLASTNRLLTNLLTHGAVSEQLVSHAGRAARAAPAASRAPATNAPRPALTPSLLSFFLCDSSSSSLTSTMQQFLVALFALFSVLNVRAALSPAALDALVSTPGLPPALDASSADVEFIPIAFQVFFLLIAPASSCLSGPKRRCALLFSRLSTFVARSARRKRKRLR